LGTSYLISEWVRGSFEVTDYLLQDILGHVRREDIVYPPPDAAEQERLSKLIIAKMNSVPNVILVGLFDQNCVLTHGNDSQIGWDGSERDYCKSLRADPNRKTFVTNAFVSTTGPLNITQSRRYLPDEPGFHGFAAVGVDLTFFSKWLSNVTIGSHGVIAISDKNLSLLARKPAKPKALGNKVNDPIVTAFLASGDTYRTFRATSPLDGEPRLYGVRKVEELPFVIVVGEANRDWQADWIQNVWMTIGGVVILWSLAFFTLLSYWSGLKNLAELKKVRDKLEELSVTDALTGLANRRRFDEVLETECRRIQRITASLSVIMIDVDHFKAFNDTYGHQAGDECLKAVAKVLRNSLKRPQDLAARYGGEEFSCILPETEHAGAIKIANSIKNGIAGLDIRHEGSTAADYVTASLGVATLVCDGKTRPEGIVNLAHRRLYWAKENGRNRLGSEEHVSEQ
jgi:diguanylate cyclase (GGDEF)-like protein